MRSSIALLFFLAFCSVCQATGLENFSVKLQGFSAELELVARQLAEDKTLSDKTAKKALEAAAVINSDFQSIPRSNALFLVKTEIYKGLLENPLLPLQDEVLINESLAKGIEKKLKDHEIVYSPFAKWLMESILLELAPYRKDKFLDKYQTASGSDPSLRAKALEARRLAEYLSPWIVAFNENTPEGFNSLASAICADLLSRIASKAYYFKQFSSRFSGAGIGELFQIPSIKTSDSAKAPLPSASLKEASSKAKQEGQKVLESLEKAELENPSPAIDKLIERQGEEDGKSKSEWVPR